MRYCSGRKFDDLVPRTACVCRSICSFVALLTLLRLYFSAPDEDSPESPFGTIQTQSTLVFVWCDASRPDSPNHHAPLVCPADEHTHAHDTSDPDCSVCQEEEEAKAKAKAGEGVALSSADHGHSHGHNEHAHEGQEYDPDCAECNDEGHGHGHVRQMGKRVMDAMQYSAAAWGRRSSTVHMCVAFFVRAGTVKVVLL